jgi:hypothetical protein
MKHVLTWDTDDLGPDTIGITPAQAAPYLNALLTVPQTGALVKSAGIKSALYSDPNRVAPGTLMWTDNESTFAHDCSNNRITVQNSNDLLMDVHSNVLWGLWAQSIKTEENWGAQFDWVFEDSADEIQTQKLSAQPCNFNQADWTNYTNQMDSSLGLPIVYNGLGLIPGNTSTPGPSIGLNPTTVGGLSEDCYSGRTPTGYFYQPHWFATENTEIQMQENSKLFVCESDWWGDAAQSTGQRLYQYASFLLTYDVNSQYVKSMFQSPSELHVMPEAQLVALNPIVATPSNISGLLLSTGLYGREYKDCYIGGKYIGPCAAVVNPNNPKSGPPLQFPWSSKYHHTLVTSGEGWYDGGTVSAKGPAPASTVPGATGIIVFP